MAEEPFDIRYAAKAREDVKALRAYDRKRIVDAAERHLRHTPVQVSRSRIKRMAQPFWCQFRLRVDEFRVYYDVDAVGRTVSILRVLTKEQEETPEEPPP
jgi:mRNA-degrading endonuclease RelE of RelBE toxin-antitoxin system